MAIRVKRVYEKTSPADGKRYLVDRVWPRGVKKEDAGVEEWLKELGPTTELRKWFGHDPERWEEFKERYFEELSAKRDFWEPLLKASRRGTVTLVYSARDEEHNQAVALRDFLESRR